MKSEVDTIDKIGEAKIIMQAKMKKAKRIPIIDMILFVLIFMNELTSIYVFSNIENLAAVINYAQIISYVALLYLIIKRKYKTTELIPFAFVGVLLLLGYRSSGQAAFFKGFLLILAAKGISTQRLLKVCRFSFTTILVLSVTLWITGISNSGIGRRDSIAIGFVHPNVAAQIIMLIFLLWILEKGTTFDLNKAFITEIAAVCVLLITGSRTSTFILACAPFVLRISQQIMYSQKQGLLYKIYVTMAQYIQLLLMLFSYITALYLEQSSFFQKLDLIFSNRIFLNYYLLRKNGIKLFGQNVSLVDNSGTVYNNIRDMYNWSITCDNSYIVSIIIMGVIPTAIALFGFWILMRRAIRSRNYILISIAILLALYAFCESQMLELYRFFVYFYLAAPVKSNLPQFMRTNKELATNDR